MYSYEERMRVVQLYIQYAYQAELLSYAGQLSHKLVIS